MVLAACSKKKCKNICQSIARYKKVYYLCFNKTITAMTCIEKNSAQIANLMQIINLYRQPSWVVTTSQSQNDYGTSGYIYVSCYEREKTFKFRISDHDATNSVRLATEFMLNVNSNAINVENEYLCDRVEQFIYPERFRTVRVKQYTGEVKRMTWPAGYPVKDNERIVERRIAKSGREVVVVEWDAFVVNETIERI